MQHHATDLKGRACCRVVRPSVGGGSPVCQQMWWGSSVRFRGICISLSWKNTELRSLTAAARRGSGSQRLQEDPPVFPPHLSRPLTKKKLIALDGMEPPNTSVQSPNTSITNGNVYVLDSWRTDDVENTPGVTQGGCVMAKMWEGQARCVIVHVCLSQSELSGRELKRDKSIESVRERDARREREQTGREREGENSQAGKKAQKHAYSREKKRNKN